jgi:hypothetical protein
MSQPNTIASSPEHPARTRALRMLDHVMLWVARSFAVFAVFFASCMSLDGFAKGDFIFFGSCLSLTILWLICTWSLRQRWARLFLGITSGMYLAAVFIYIAYDLQSLNLNSAHFFIFPLFGSVAMFWIALHPPPIKSDHHYFPIPRSC